MSTSHVERLLSVAGPPLGGPYVPDHSRSMPAMLGALLTARNGFYAFEGALHVFPAGIVVGEHSLEEWNSPSAWRSHYGDLAEDLLFFAEDVLGGQFAIGTAGVLTFDPETGDTQILARDVEGWAEQVLSDYEFLTAYPLAHGWQEHNGRVPVGRRLAPRTPFVLGGEFAASNLFAVDAVEGMRLRGDLASQLRDLPDGATVTYRVVG